jgi:hypothetical protein
VAVSTSILRSLYHPAYLSLIQPGYSSDAYPHDSHPSSFDRSTITIDNVGVEGESVYSRRSRETAVFDRFIAIRVGDELRRVESALSEDSGAEKEIFTRLQVSGAILNN